MINSYHQALALTRRKRQHKHRYLVNGSRLRIKMMTMQYISVSCGKEKDNIENVDGELR